MVFLVAAKARCHPLLSHYPPTLRYVAPLGCGDGRMGKSWGIGGYAMGRWIAYLSLCVALNAASEGPALSASDVVNAADHSAGRVAPGEIVVLYPRNAGPAVLAGAQLDSDGRAATMLGDTRVWFDGIAAPLAYAVSGQVCAVVPYAVAGWKTTQVVVEYQGVRSPAVELTVVPSAPALFTLDSTGQGQAAMLNEKGCCNSAPNPAVRGAFAALYATGAGQTTPSGIDGAMAAFDRAADYPVPALPVRVMVGGRPAEIQYAGAAPHAVAGLLQVNFRVPADAPTSDAVPLVLMVGDARSPDGVTMAVRSAVERVLVAEPDAVVRGWLTRVLAGAGYDTWRWRGTDGRRWRAPESTRSIWLFAAGRFRKRNGRKGCARF